MKQRLAWILLIVVLVPAAFLAGLRMHRASPASGAPSARAVLYWVDPMNPAIHSSGPGTAPCGMPFEPVYADGHPAATTLGSRVASLPAGSVGVPPDVWQLAGVRVEAAEVRSVTHAMRLFGRVMADEGRVYHLSAVTDGWIRQLSPAVTGTLVKKDQLLASYYSPETLGPQQAYVSALEAQDRAAQGGDARSDQLELNRKNVGITRQQLLNVGMGETQIEELGRTRKALPTVELRSPAKGFVLARNVSMGQRFDRTRELYVIADLERVWILADASNDDAEQLKPGTRAEVAIAGTTRTVPAVVSDNLPRFDPETKTLKVRLEASNPQFALRPEMFVDVTAAIARPPALVVPGEAVLDSGVAKTVFVDRGEGAFERRDVKTGWRDGGVIEVVEGLKVGDRIVVSGNFLLDSESRMRLARSTERGVAVDPSRPPP
jgi:Cu(I)/Ag(I) efflux system membrane fusion protein